MDEPKVIPVIIDRHIEDASFLWLQRQAATLEPHYDISSLVQLDDQLDAHLDGIRLAVSARQSLIKQLLDISEPGEIFILAWLVAETEDGKLLDTVLEQCQNSKENYQAMVSGLTWRANGADLTNILLRANDLTYQQLGLQLCLALRQDPQAQLENALKEETHLLCALQIIGVLNRRDLLNDLQHFASHPEPEIAFAADWSAALLGDWSATAKLAQQAIQNGPNAEQAISLVVRKLHHIERKNLLETLCEHTDTTRLAIQGMGHSGDPFWLPIILKHMDDVVQARVAGEAFSLITGLDLAYMDMDKDWPEGFESGPNENPMDDNVDLDADLNLPWPDSEKIKGWWQAHGAQFIPGQRYLCGKPLTKKQCHDVLTNSYQRQRHAAALELALMGEPYFNVYAPGTQQLTKLRMIK